MADPEITEAGALVEHDAEKPCCFSCKSEQDEGYNNYADYCCCAHGTLYGWQDDGEVIWAWDGAEAEWAEKFGEASGE